MDMSETET